MSAKQYRILFFALTMGLLVVLMIGGLPTPHLELASGQGDPYAPTRGPTRTRAATPTPSFTPTATATVSPFDPFVGSSAPANFQLPEEATLSIIEDTLLYWEPDLEASTGLFVVEGQEFAVSGVDESGEWVRISFAGESAWVPREQTSLPPIRIQTPDPASLLTPEGTEEPADLEALAEEGTPEALDGTPELEEFDS